MMMYCLVKEKLESGSWKALQWRDSIENYHLLTPLRLKWKMFMYSKLCHNKTFGIKALVLVQEQWTGIKSHGHRKKVLIQDCDTSNTVPTRHCDKATYDHSVWMKNVKYLLKKSKKSKSCFTKYANRQTLWVNITFKEWHHVFYVVKNNRNVL